MIPFFRTNYTSYFLTRTVLIGLLLCVSQACKKDTVVSPQEPEPTPAKHLKIIPVARNLEVPWGMAFLPDGDLLFTERSGRISILKKDSAYHTTLMFHLVDQGSEGGMLGLAVDPDFNTSHYVFIYETVTAFNHVMRLKYENNVLVEDKVILDSIPKAVSHDGGVIRFGPDGYLYVGTGDALKPNSSQDRNSLSGKILRIDKNGIAAPGNPFNSKVWTYGHRNVQGFDWMPDGKMIAVEHGPTSEFGWCCHDEVNYIVPGKNYGWPLVIGDTKADTLTAPLIQSDFETWAPSGCTFIKGKQWGDWENNLVVGCLRSRNLMRFKISSTPGIIQKADTLKDVYLRLRNVIQGPDGSIYFGSSNIGIYPPAPPQGDDKIFKLSFE